MFTLAPSLRIFLTLLLGFPLSLALAQQPVTSNLPLTPAMTVSGQGTSMVSPERLSSPAPNPQDQPQPATSTAPPSQRQPAPPSLFQRFVKEATGEELPIFGSQLFDAPDRYTADATLAPPGEYVLGPGDEVQLQIWGAVDYAGSHTLDRNGQVNLPKVGSLALAGVRLQDLETVLRAQIGKVFTNFNVNASLGRLRSIQVYLVGQALQPGAHQVSSLSSLVNAIFVSGGPSPSGSLRAIQLKRNGRTVTTLDLYEFIAKGDKGRDTPLQAGDVIVIPPAGPQVAVNGALDQAAIYELKAGFNQVGDILSLSGGVPVLANTRRALIERIVPGQTPPRQVLDITLDDTGLKTPLQDGDVLTLLDISPAFGNAVTLQGTVAAPLRYPWFQGMRVLDLIPERDALITTDYYRRKNLLVRNADTAQQAGQGVAQRAQGLLDQINWDYAVIERLNPVTLSTELIPFNLGKAVLQKDPTHNLTLDAGDVVTILSHSDLRLPQDRQTRLVRVEGEVAAPGVYQTQPGETLPQLLQRIGGLTPHAYVFGTEFTRESVRTRQQENLDLLIRRLETQAQAQASSVIANLGSESAQQAQLIRQQQQAQLQSQIQRLKTMRSNGRMALELPPTAQDLAALPALPLEDGDRIIVPPKPGFVAAFGSVNNENVFIYKPGKTVSDVIRNAGLTEDAEPDQAFVLRADGTIVARRDHGGFFGNRFDALELMPGDTVVVPAQVDRESRYNFFTRALKDWTQIFSNFGLGVAALKSIDSL